MRIVGQIFDVPVLQVMEDTVEVVRFFGRIHFRTVEEIVDVLVP